MKRISYFAANEKPRGTVLVFYRGGTHYDALVPTAPLAPAGGACSPRRMMEAQTVASQTVAVPDSPRYSPPLKMHKPNAVEHVDLFALPESLNVVSKPAAALAGMLLAAVLAS